MFAICGPTVFAVVPASVVTTAFLLLSQVAPSDALRRRIAYGIVSLFAAAAILVPMVEA